MSHVNYNVFRRKATAAIGLTAASLLLTNCSSETSEPQPAPDPTSITPQVDVPCNIPSTTTLGPGAIRTNGNAKTAFELLTTETEYTDAAAATMVGEMMLDSGANPAYTGNSGYSRGMLAVSPGTWQKIIDYAAETHQDPQCVSPQITQLTTELASKEFTELQMTLTTSSDIETTTEAFTKEYVRPGSPERAYAIRLAYAREALDAFA